MAQRDDVLLIAASVATASALISAGTLLYLHWSQPSAAGARTRSSTVRSGSTRRVSASAPSRSKDTKCPSEISGRLKEFEESHRRATNGQTDDFSSSRCADLYSGPRSSSATQLRRKASDFWENGYSDHPSAGSPPAAGRAGRSSAQRPVCTLPRAVLEAQSAANEKQQPLPRALLEAQARSAQSDGGKRTHLAANDLSLEFTSRSPTPGASVRGVNQAELNLASSALAAIYKNVGTKSSTTQQLQHSCSAVDVATPVDHLQRGHSNGSRGIGGLRSNAASGARADAFAAFQLSREVLQARQPPVALRIPAGSGSTASSSLNSYSSSSSLSSGSICRRDSAEQGPTMTLGSLAATMKDGGQAADDKVAKDGAAQSAAGMGGLGATHDWELDGASLELCRFEDGTPWQLGQGSFGTVYKALSHGVQPVAVKIFPTHATPRQHKEFQREVSLLKSCRDGNIVQFLGASQTDGQTLMITEFMENGDLYSAIRKDTPGQLLWYKKDGTLGGGEPGLGCQIALDIARGLYFLHRHQVVHFDLKSPNVLLGRQHVAKIADVGLAKILQKDYVSSLQSVGTFAWSAPEVLLGARCSEKVDIFSLGVMLWELVTGEIPTRGQLRPLRVPQDCPAVVADLISCCMDSDPSKRPSAKDVVITLSQPQATGDRTRTARAARQSDQIVTRKAEDGQQQLLDAIIHMCHVVGGPGSAITHEEAVAAAALKDDMRTYKMYVREVEKTLAMEGVEDEGSASHSRLEALVAAHRGVIIISMQEHTTATRRYQFLSLQEAAAYISKSDTSDVSDEPGMSDSKQSAPPLPVEPAQQQQVVLAAVPTLEWSVILDSLQLTDHQRKSLVAARAVAVQRLKGITVERKRLMSALHNFVLQTPISGGFVSAVDHSEALKATLEQEGALLQDFHIIFTCKTLTALQQARLEVGAFPCIPDAMTVCSMIALEAEGQPSSVPPPESQEARGYNVDTAVALERHSKFLFDRQNMEASSSGSNSLRTQSLRSQSL